MTRHGTVVVFPTVGTRVGGSLVSTAMMAEALSRRSDVAPRVVLPRDGENASVFTERGVEVDEYDLPANAVRRIRLASGAVGYLRASPGLVLAFRRALAYLAGVRADLVHVNDDRSFLPWAWAARRYGLPVVWHVRQERPSPLLDRLRLRLSDQLIYVADANRSRFHGARRTPPSVTIHNWIDPGTFRPADDRTDAKRRLDLDASVPVVGFVGNLVPRKRPEWAIDAVGALRDRGIDVQLAVVGDDFSADGSYLARLRERAAHAGVEERIRFLGFRRDVPDLMRAFDVLVLTSTLRGEAFPRSVIEAMASGAAVVATDVAGVGEAIEDGVSGLLVDPLDAGAFTEALGRVLMHDDLRTRLQTGGVARARERFSEARAVDALLAVYGNLVAVP